MTERTDDFLRRYGMHPDSVDLDRVREEYIAEMTAGLRGMPSSLKMLPTYLSARGRLPEAGTAVAVDIGGTNLRVAATSYSGGTFRIHSLDESPVPGLTSEITGEVFLGELAEKLRPVLGHSDNVGVCFSHAAEILPSRDGKVIAFSKEIKVTGAAGMELARELSRTLAEKGGTARKNYVVLNDTAAVLLGGMASPAGLGCHDHVGFVLGTGMNICYTEKTSEIKKLRGDFGENAMLVNTETGYFSGVPQGAADLELDRTSANPGMNFMEKMTAGRYLGPLVLLTLRHQAAEGILSPPAREALLQLRELPLPAVSAFLSGPSGGGLLAELCRNDRDREAVYTAADRLVTRAAKLTAAAILAVLEKTGAGAAPESPACIAAEGSTLYKLSGFRAKFESFLETSRPGGARRYARIVTAQNATILGAALAAMMNRAAAENS